MTLPEIITQLEACHFECEAGPLEMNVAFVELKMRSMATCQEKRMDKFKVLVKLLDRFTPVYVRADWHEVVEGVLIFYEDDNRKATFAAGEWIGVLKDNPQSDGADGAR